MFGKKKGKHRAKKAAKYPGGHNLMKKLDKANKKGKGSSS